MKGAGDLKLEEEGRAPLKYTAIFNWGGNAGVMSAHDTRHRKVMASRFHGLEAELR